MSDDTPVNATLLDNDRPKRELFHWPLWLTLSAGGLFVTLLRSTTTASLDNTTNGNMVGGIFGILAALAFLTSFVQAHFKVRRRDGANNPWLAKTVLFFGYALIVAALFGILMTWKPGGVDIGPTIGGILGLVIVGFIAYVVAMGYNLVPPPGEYRLYRKLPTVDEYLAKYPLKPGQPIACYKCNSRSINNDGLLGERDARRIHYCKGCGTILYKTHGLTY